MVALFFFFFFFNDTATTEIYTLSLHDALPISTLLKPLATVDLKTMEPARAHYERSDICVVPAAGGVGEAMVALVLAGVLLEKFGSDSMAELHRNVEGYLQEMRR